MNDKICPHCKGSGKKEQKPDEGLIKKIEQLAKPTFKKMFGESKKK